MFSTFCRNFLSCWINCFQITQFTYLAWEAFIRRSHTCTEMPAPSVKNKKTKWGNHFKSPETTLRAVWWSGTVASLWGCECDLEMVLLRLHRLPGGMRSCWRENIVSMGGTSLWPPPPPPSPTLCLTLPPFPAAQGHVMVWERLMHLQRHAVKSN